MAKFIINGQKSLNGELSVLGAKNAAIKMIAGCILIKEPVTLTNVPDISDISKLCQILENLGAVIERDGHRLTINCDNLTNKPLDQNLVRSIRASVVLIGPLLARFGKIKISHPGGDKIGVRPIDRHLKAFADLGIKVDKLDNFYQFQKGNLVKKSISFEKISVTGTENILLFAALQNQEIIINNAAIEPEIIDLADFLKKAGVNIKIDGRRISIHGNNNLHGLSHRVIPDRIEAGTFAVLAAATFSELKITHINIEHLKPFLGKLREIGVQFDVGSDFLYIKKSLNLRAANISTAPYPGFSTDWQPPLGVLLTQANGTSYIQENIFENRLGYLKVLKNMGANINLINNCQAEITGPSPLVGRCQESLDIRSGVTLIIAGLIASGQTIINDAENIDRGYEKIEERLAKIGAEIQRVA